MEQVGLCARAWVVYKYWRVFGWSRRCAAEAVWVQLETVPVISSVFKVRAQPDTHKPNLNFAFSYFVTWFCLSYIYNLKEWTVILFTSQIQSSRINSSVPPTTRTFVDCSLFDKIWTLEGSLRYEDQLVWPNTRSFYFECSSSQNNNFAAWSKRGAWMANGTTLTHRTHKYKRHMLCISTRKQIV